MKVSIILKVTSLWKKRAEDGGCSHYDGNGRLQSHRLPWLSAKTPMWRSAEVPSSGRCEHELSQAPLPSKQITAGCRVPSSLHFSQRDVRGHLPLLCHPPEQQRATENCCRGWHWGAAVPLSHPAPRAIVPCAPFPPSLLTSLPCSITHGRTWSQPFPRGTRRVESGKQAPGDPTGHPALVPHLGCTSGRPCQLCCAEPRTAAKLLMLSCTKAVKPQMALETSCCDGCPYFSLAS